ncbi:MAG: leucine-rich repeat domain-containing protein, partial [Bacteroidaceae bacterium]|nr:leucine-rich repeat domain-containing protein [Bacteroidaceae bacterium]
PDEVTTIPQNAFGGYRGLNSIDFNKVETIGALAFQECDIESVTFSEFVREIGMGAFQSCQSLSSIYLPSSIELLSEDAFAFCPALMSVSYDVVKFPESGGFANSIFTRSPIDKATLYVPTNMIEACKTEEPWSNFGQILPLPTGTNPNAVESTFATSPRGTDAVYDLQGRRFSGESLSKGVYIVNGKKVLIK